jgi:hypothetical protein
MMHIENLSYGPFLGKLFISKIKNIIINKLQKDVDEDICKHRNRTNKKSIRY